MSCLLPLFLATLAADPQRPFTSPASQAPESGHGLTEREARAGWISLFDGRTTFGWKDAQVENGALRGGETTTAFGDYELKAEVVAGGEITLGGQTVRLSPSPVQRTVRGGTPAPVRLAPGVRLKTLLVRPLGLEPTFNGESLDGWTVIPHPPLAEERQTVWSVQGGVIRAVGGPGALELDGRRYGDFVLQVEARTRAKLVNAGVFVRAVPGEFLNGYEAQIFNACYEHNPAQPARYSTGAIDDRQLARRLVSRDEVPFVMTVVAVGPQIATWVNGCQMTDWTDTRQPHENPRQGRREEPGFIQLQAHDQGTDIEFRRLRIGTVK